jgi:hypothetical protein
MPNLAQIKTKRITVHRWEIYEHFLWNFVRASFLVRGPKYSLHSNSGPFLILAPADTLQWKLNIFLLFCQNTQYWGSVQWSPTVDMKLRYGYPSSWIWCWFRKKFHEKVSRGKNYCTLYGNDKIPSLLCLQLFATFQRFPKKSVRFFVFRYQHCFFKVQASAYTLLICVQIHTVQCTISNR